MTFNIRGFFSFFILFPNNLNRALFKTMEYVMYMNVKKPIAFLSYLKHSLAYNSHSINGWWMIKSTHWFHEFYLHMKTTEFLCSSERNVGEEMEEEEMKRKEVVERRWLTETKRRESAGFTLQYISYSVIEPIPGPSETCTLEALSIVLKQYFYFQHRIWKVKRYSICSCYSE